MHIVKETDMLTAKIDLLKNLRAIPKTRLKHRHFKPWMLS